MAKYKIQREYIFSNKSYIQICDFLREYDKINLRDVRDNKGNTCLHQAAYNPQGIKTLKKYLQYMQKYYSQYQRTDPQGSFHQFVNTQNTDGLTALHFAAYKGHYKAMDQLCRSGADYLKTTKSGQNVLHLAAQGGMVEAFIFFQSLVDINCKDSKNSTPLHWASYMNSQSIVTYLLANVNVDINAQDQNMQTPLHLAAAYGHTKIVKKLLRAGANRSIVNNKNQTAFKIAQDNQFRNIQRILNQKYTCMDYFKIGLNLKTIYKPESRSIRKPIMFIIIFLAIVFLRHFLLAFVQELGFLEYVQIGFCAVILLLYLSLIIGPNKKPPQKYVHFLNGHISMKKVCLTCALLKPNRSMHCQICKVCIQRYDHHCFWINNCVGKRNLKNFICFIMIFQLYLFYTIAICLLTLYNAFRHEDEPKLIIYPKQQYKIISVIYVISIGLFSFIFSFPMLHLVIEHIKNLLLNKTTYQRFTKDNLSTFTESSSHLLAEEMKSKKNNRKYSFSNARTMCRDDDLLEGDNINSSLASQK